MKRFIFWLNRKKRIREKDVVSVALLVRIIKNAEEMDRMIWFYYAG